LAFTVGTDEILVYRRCNER